MSLGAPPLPRRPPGGLHPSPSQVAAAALREVEALRTEVARLREEMRELREQRR